MVYNSVAQPGFNQEKFRIRYKDVDYDFSSIESREGPNDLQVIADPIEGLHIATSGEGGMWVAFGINRPDTPRDWKKFQPGPVIPIEATTTAADFVVSDIEAPSDILFESSEDASNLGYRLGPTTYLRPGKWAEAIRDQRVLDLVSQGKPLVNLSDAIGQAVTIFKEGDTWFVADVKPGRKVTADFIDSASVTLPTFGSDGTGYSTPDTTSHRFSTAAPNSIAKLNASRQVTLGTRYSLTYRSYTFKYDRIDDELRAHLRLMLGLRDVPAPFIRELWPFGRALLAFDAQSAVVSAGRNQGGYALVGQLRPVVIDGPEVLDLAATNYETGSEHVGWISSGEFDGPADDRVVFGDKLWNNQRVKRFYRTSKDAVFVVNSKGELIAVVSRATFNEFASDDKVAASHSAVMSAGAYQVPLSLIDHVYDILDRLTTIPTRIREYLVAQANISGVRGMFEVIDEDTLLGAKRKLSYAAYQAAVNKAAELERTVSEKSSKISELEAKIAACEQASTSKSAQIAELTEQVTTLRAEVVRLNALIASGSADAEAVERLTRQLAEANEKNAQLTAQTAELTTSLSECHVSLATLQTTVDSQREALTGKDREIARMAQLAQEATDKLSRAETQRDQALADLSQVRSHLQNCQAGTGHGGSSVRDRALLIGGGAAVGVVGTVIGLGSTKRRR